MKPWKRLVFLGSSLVVLLAGTSLSEAPSLRIHPFLQPYFKQFLDDCKRHNAPCPRADAMNLTMLYVTEHPELTDEMRAFCLISWDPLAGMQRLVVVRYYPGEHEFETRATVYHELYHCVLLMRHPTENDTRLWAPQDRPFSLLDPYHRADWHFYAANWDALVEATFNDSKE